MTLLFFLKSHFGPIRAEERKTKPKVSKKTLKKLRRTIAMSEVFSLEDIKKYILENEEQAQRIREEFVKKKFKKELEELISVGIL